MKESVQGGRFDSAAFPAQATAWGFQLVGAIAFGNSHGNGNIQMHIRTIARVGGLYQY
jgi:hypothetical protein